MFVCSFGKLQKAGTQGYSTPDVTRSLLAMVTMNVAQISYMNATLHGLKNIFFSGSFLRDHPLIWENLSSAIQYWSKGEMRALFLLHDGYLGALGALLEESCGDQDESSSSSDSDSDDNDSTGRSGRRSYDCAVPRGVEDCSPTISGFVADPELKL